MSKVEELKKIEEEMRADKSLQLETNLVFGEGDPDCGVMFIGEAPGEQEDIQKRPFVGRGGQLLNKMLEKIGWKREEVYITNIVKRRPPNNRDPLPEEIETYKQYLTKQIEIINPKIIATLGRFSMNYFNPNLKISRDHGKVFRLNASRRPITEGDLGMNGRLLVPFFHPAAILRNPNLLNEYEKEFKKLPKIVEKFDELLNQSSKAAPAENKFLHQNLF